MLSCVPVWVWFSCTCTPSKKKCVFYCLVLGFYLSNHIPHKVPEWNMNRWWLILLHHGVLHVALLRQSLQSWPRSTSMWYSSKLTWMKWRWVPAFIFSSYFSDFCLFDHEEKKKRWNRDLIVCLLKFFWLIIEIGFLCACRRLPKSGMWRQCQLSYSSRKES